MVNRLTPNKRFFKPSPKEVERYLNKWNKLENYSLQEDALNRLFFEYAPQNVDTEDVLLKAAALNDFYSTNILDIYTVAKHISQLKIDDSLNKGTIELIDKIRKVVIDNKERNFYSFATKYCSHHKPDVYPIYDRYVDKVLRYLRNTYQFSDFINDELKDYKRFVEIIDDFKSFFGLNEFSYKKIDRYLWLVGKEQFSDNKEQSEGDI